MTGWLPLSLLCAFSLASADAATKAWLQGFSVRELTVVRLGIGGLLMTPLLAELPPLASLPLGLWWWLAVLVPLELLAMLLYMAAIRDHPLSLTLPYLAFTPVFAIAIAWLMLGERVTAQGGFGILLVVAGTWLLNADQARAGDWRGWLKPFRAILHERGSRMMLAVAAIYAVTSTLGKGAMRYLEPRSSVPSTTPSWVSRRPWSSPCPSHASLSRSHAAPSPCSWSARSSGSWPTRIFWPSSRWRSPT